MTPAAAARLAVSLPADDLEPLRVAAAEAGTSVGLLVRVLIRHGLARLDDDEELRVAVAAEIDRERTRRAEVGRAAMDSRWGKTSPTTDEDRR